MLTERPHAQAKPLFAPMAADQVDTDIPNPDPNGIEGLIEEIASIGAGRDFHDAAELLAARLFRFMMIDENLLFNSITNAGPTGLIATR